MQILFIHQNFPGQFKHLAPRLAQQGHDVRALAITGREITGVALTNYRVKRKNTAGIHPLAHEFETKVIRAESCALAMLTLKRQGFDPNVIMGHPGWGETLFCKEIFPNAKLLHYLEFHYGKDKGDSYFDPEFQQPNLVHDIRLRVKNANNFLALDAMDLGLTPTQWQWSALPSYLHDKVEIIFDGIDTEVVRPDPTCRLRIQPPSGADLTFAAGDEVMTFVCRNLEPYRGYHSLMRSLPMILKARPEAHVLIVGGDETSYGAQAPRGQTWKEIFLNEVKDAIDLDRVHFLGKVPYDTFLKIIQVSRCHLYLTYPFVLSWSCLEAMSAGTVVVGSKTPPVQEFIEHERNGLLVDFFDYHQIAETVIRVLTEPEQFTSMRSVARQTIIERCDLKTVCLPRQVTLVEQLAAVR